MFIIIHTLDSDYGKIYEFLTIVSRLYVLYKSMLDGSYKIYVPTKLSHQQQQETENILENIF